MTTIGLCLGVCSLVCIAFESFDIACGFFLLAGVFYCYA